MTVVLSQFAKNCLKGLIRFYQLVISPWLGANCRFMPSCSAYALEAIERHGSLRGSWLAAKRLSKCHPIKWLGSSQGYDPVPPADSVSAKCEHHQ